MMAAFFVTYLSGILSMGIGTHYYPKNWVLKILPYILLLLAMTFYSIEVGKVDFLGALIPTAFFLALNIALVIYARSEK
ncbi:hypothetical protein [Falsihalocynthiibacter arcticus]|uniref:Uncharacterized protein n=1 Tax=Falsihalocynthiibacter arcticus TaxID=1579316 RepID=A0A126V646_9RHOB|nr:hypothetical protein [Falsihalocynthiibacter arcticus]AML53798.1 hypothetical protein RC74_21325 [Falsihalocynthiibacter arcticus]